MSKVYSNIRLFSQIIGRAAACLVALFVFTAAASALTYTVDTTASDAALSACTAAVNDCSLRGAIAKANATAAPDTIDFAIPAGDPNCPGGVCTITSVGTNFQIINAATAGALTIINSTGARNLLLSGGNATRVFLVNTGANLTLSGVTVTKGSASSGGGIFNANGTLSLTNSIVSGNAARLDGGGIYNDNGGTTTLTNSTVSGNTSTESNGGGIYHFSGIMTLTNSTVSGNTAAGSGGGFYNLFETLNLRFVTVADNRAGTSGGGIFNQMGTAYLLNTIIAKNTAASSPDFSGVITNTSYFNLIGDGTGMSGIANGVDHNRIGTSANRIDPLLGSLANNGGPTPTHALLLGSPAIDKGNAAPGTDQRGLPRPVDLAAYANVTVGNGADIGAFEAQTAPLAPAPDLTIVKSHTGNFTQGDIGRTYSITVTNSGNTATSGTVSVVDTLPSGLTATAISGTGWSCTLATLTCTRSDALAAAGSYPAITLTVNVANNAPSNVTNTATVSGGGENNTANNTANDVTSVNPDTTYAVDTTTDNAALSACTSAANDCSLRGAIARANATTDNDSIGFALPPGINTITLAPPGELIIDNVTTAGTLLITNSTGASNLLISGNNTSRVFFVYPGANLTLNAVTVTQGRTPGSGGGINNQGTLSLTNSTVSGNTAQTNDGGGIFNINGTLSLTNSTVSGNAGQSGGGIDNSSGTTTLTNSTVSGNTATLGGGGIINRNSGTLTLLNSTVSGNSANDGRGGGAGAGIFNSGIINLTSVTVAFNSAGGFGAGGVTNTGTANLSNTIVARNTASVVPDFEGAISSTSSFNLIGDGTRTTGITNGTNGNQIGIDPNLGSLALNGGTTLNHALLGGSPAIDTGSNAFTSVSTDQRGTGFARVRDGNGDGTPTVDIGAFELQLGTTAATVSVSGRVTARGRAISNAVVHLTNQSGEIQTVRTNRLGYYTFTDLAAGDTYIFNVFSKRYQFDPRVINLMEDLSELDFTAQQPN